MAKIFKNIILIILLSAVIIMMIGILFYDYIPNGAEVKEVNKYVTEERTTKTLASIKQDEEVLFEQLYGSTSNSGDTTDVEEPQVIIHSYSLDAGDLKVFEQSKSYESGKANPFADLIEETESEEGGDDSSVGGTTTGNSNGSYTQVTDNTIFNSTNSK